MLRKLKRNIQNMMYGIIGEIQSSRYDITKTVVVTGCPRSGSTWLGEMFNQLQGVVMLWEPMHIRNQPQLEKLGFTWRPVVNKENVTREQKRFFIDLLSGRSLNWHLVSKVSLSDVIACERWVLKFVRGNGLVEWLVDEFGIQVPTVLIRHPCAVVHSQMKRRKMHGTESEQESLNELRNGVPNKMQEFLRTYPEYKHIMHEIETWEELLAAIWAMDYYHILSKDLPKWILVSYEGLVTSGESTLKSIFDFYNLDYREINFDTLLNKPSSTVVKGSQIDEDKDPLVGWTKHLSSEQVQRILATVNKFGITCYTDQLEPDYEFLNKKSVLQL